MNRMYNFNPEEAFNQIKEDWLNFANEVHCSKWALGVSGGKDSTVVAWLAAKIFGADSVYGVMMPSGVQIDIGDSQQVIHELKIKPITINIADAFNSIVEQIKEQNSGDEPTDTTVINIPPRLRMTAVYAVAQNVGAVVLNTSNLTEDILGYCTLWGDSVGSYAPLQNLTVTEVIQLGEWLGIPDNLIHKVPADGLQGSTDEDRLGLKYAEVDRYIRLNKGNDEFKAKVLNCYVKNKFKLNMINMRKPGFYDLPNYVHADGGAPKFIVSITTKPKCGII